MEQAPQITREYVAEVSNRRLANMLKTQFISKRDYICRRCSLCPAFCRGSAAEWHRCRYALRVLGDRVLFATDAGVSSREGEKESAESKELYDLIVKTLQRTNTLLSQRKAVTPS